MQDAVVRNIKVVYARFVWLIYDIMFLKDFFLAKHESGVKNCLSRQVFENIHGIY